MDIRTDDIEARVVKLSQEADQAPVLSEERQLLVATISELLIQFPEHAIGKMYGKWPLLLSLELQGGLDTIQKLFGLLCGDPIVKQGLWGRDDCEELIHYACRYSPGDILEYLLQEIPSNVCLSSRNDEEFYPFNTVMMNEKKPTLPPETLLRLWQAVPQGSGSFEISFLVALLCNQPVEILELMAKRRRTCYEAFELDSCGCPAELTQQALPLRLYQIKAIAPLIFLHSKAVLVYQPGWDAEALEYLWTELGSNKTLKRLEGIKLPEISDPLLHSLRDCLQRNTTLTVMTLDLADEPNLQVWISWWQAIDAGLVNNASIQSLWLDNNMGDQRTRVIYTRDESTQQLQRTLRIQYFDVTAPEFTERLQSQFPLNGLLLEGSLHGALSTQAPIHVAGLMEFLARAPSLKCLDIINANIDPLPIFQALQHHSNLTRFTFLLRVPQFEEPMKAKPIMAAALELVQYHNVTLTQLDPWQRWDSKIAYYLALNAAGRATIRSTTSANGKVLLDLLVSVHNHIDWMGIPCFHTNMTYGLLRETPSLWCYQSDWSRL